MDRMISQRELRNETATVIRGVQSGRTFILTRNGTPVAEIRPLPPRRFVSREVIAEAGPLAARINAEQFRFDLDSVVDPLPID